MVDLPPLQPLPEPLARVLARYVSEPADDLAATLQDAINKAFMDGVISATERASVEAIVDSLNANDIEAIVRHISPTEGDFSQLNLAIRNAFHSFGMRTVTSIPQQLSPEGFKLTVQFNVRNPSAERWLSEESGTLIQEIVRDQHTAIRTHLTTGMATGQGPRTTALNLVGRISPVSKRREGGIIGLHSVQERWVANYQRDLASSDPAVLRSLLNRGLRDKRFDRTVQKAINEGTTIPADTQSRMRTAYANRTLKYRADNIARTETLRSMGAAQTEGYQQAINKGTVDPKTIKRYWVTAGDERVRPTHRMIPRMNPNGVGWNEPFRTPTGPSMHAPHDYDINCRCRERVHIDFMARFRRAAA